jgi:hypothetical protein
VKGGAAILSALRSAASAFVQPDPLLAIVLVLDIWRDYEHEYEEMISATGATL